MITNAPFTLNVDCDMFVNNPKIVQHAMCILLDSKGEKEVAFVQCPQQFYATLKDDPFGNQMVILFKFAGAGLAGLQGPFYGGTNCFHRRKVIYGLSPDNIEKGTSISQEEIKQKFGASKELIKSVVNTLEGRTYSPNDINVSKNVEAASQVADYGYEYRTGWGDQVGWIYGSITEDVLTGLSIHEKGWRSEFCLADPIAFRGCAPIGGPNSMAQQKSAWHICGSSIGACLQLPKCVMLVWLHIAILPTPISCPSVLLKLLGISDTVFDITKKDLPPSNDGGDDRDAGSYWGSKHQHQAKVRMGVD
ncbi:Nucleotide-diphospho-sugar transferase [Sesbania bispinosa]|nr:Nucleotide-diphospho-sugar transferase [Sesbania bispinosa]